MACKHRWYSNHRVRGTDKIITVCHDQCEETLRVIYVPELGDNTSDLLLDLILHKGSGKPVTEEEWDARM